MNPCCCEGRRLFYRSAVLLLCLGYYNPDHRGLVTSLDSLCPSESVTHKQSQYQPLDLFVSQDNVWAWEAWRCNLQSGWRFVQCECPTEKEVLESLPCWIPGQNKMHRVMLVSVEEVWLSLLQCLAIFLSHFLPPFITLPAWQSSGSAVLKAILFLFILFIKDS
jgi:hypothetical protein